MGRLKVLRKGKPATCWHVGQLTSVEHRKAWEQYAFDTPERPKAGHRSREWTAVGESELDVAREMARCLRLIGAGQVPD